MVRLSRWIAASIGIAAVYAVLIILAVGIFIIPQSQTSSNPPGVVVSKTTCDRPAGFVLIIADLSGFNGSISHGAPSNPWPVIRVQRGDILHLLVCNTDQTQPHGFAIGNYLEPGVVMAPGDAYTIVFSATEAGTFRVYCNVFCTVHVFMVGQLVVT